MSETIIKLLEQIIAEAAAYTEYSEDTKDAFIRIKRLAQHAKNFMSKE